MSYLTEGKTAVVGQCGKCGRPVTVGNDAGIVNLVAGIIQHHGPNFTMNQIDRASLAFSLIGSGIRHFLPEGGCEGSPSRAQYVSGQPRDTRGYPYVEENERLFRAAWAWLEAHDWKLTDSTISDGDSDEGVGAEA
jgi:hypothetical protein